MAIAIAIIAILMSWSHHGVSLCQCYSSMVWIVFTFVLWLWVGSSCCLLWHRVHCIALWSDWQQTTLALYDIGCCSSITSDKLIVQRTFDDLPLCLYAFIVGSVIVGYQRRLIVLYCRSSINRTVCLEFYYDTSLYMWPAERKPAVFAHSLNSFLLFLCFV